MNQHIKYIRKRLEWLKELEKEIACYVQQIESQLKIIERGLKNGTRNNK